jgi:V/A-type H+-transporting ATPase subunit K
MGMNIIIAVLVGLVPLVPAFVYMVGQRQQKTARTARRLLLGLSGANLLIVLALVVGWGVIRLLSPTPVWAAGQLQTTTASPYASLAAGIAVGLGSLGAGYAVGNTGAAAIGVIAEKPEAFGRVLIFVGLAEGIAIYGLVIAFMVLA